MNREQSTTNDLIAKAMKDAAFRQALLADPRGVIEQETGMTLPEGVEIQVLEETPTTRYLVLPAQPETSDELSDAELETAAGGLLETYINCPTRDCSKYCGIDGD